MLEFVPDSYSVGMQPNPPCNQGSSGSEKSPHVSKSVETLFALAVTISPTHHLRVRMAGLHSTRKVSVSSPSITTKLSRQLRATSCLCL